VSYLGLSSFAPWIVGHSLNVSNGKVYSIWQHSKILVILAARTVNDGVFDFFYMMANYLENSNDDIFEEDFDILKIILSISILLMNKVFIRDSA
jgi:hypothetical protein